MRLSKQMAALALACAAGVGAAGAAFGQGAPPRAVQVTPRPAEPPTEPAPAAPANPAQAPADEHQRAVELYRAHFGGELTKATYLGVGTSPVPAALRQHLGLPEGVGLVVDFVEPDSPAGAAGLKQYDILTRCNDQILVNDQQLAVLVRSYKPGDEIQLALIRGGKEQSLSARLVEKEVKPLRDLFSGFPAPAEANLKRSPLDLPERPAARRARDAARDNRPGPNGKPPRHGAAGGGGGGGGGDGERALAVWRDNHMTLTLDQRPGDAGRHLVVTDTSGKVLFDGNLDDENDRRNLPKPIEEKVRQMESNLPQPGRDEGGDVDLRFDAAPSPDEKTDGHHGLDVRIDRGPSSKGPIGADDLLTIAMDDIHGPGIRTVKTARVRDGRVRLPYVEPIQCAGLTPEELEKQIVSAYARAKVAANVNVRVRKVVPAEKKDPARP